MHEWFCDWYRIKEWLRLPVEVTCAQEGHPEITAQDQSLMAFECLHGWRLHTFSGQPVPVLIHALTKKKKSVYWCSEAASSILLCAFCLVLSLGTIRSVWLSPWHAAFRYLMRSLPVCDIPCVLPLFHRFNLSDCEGRLVFEIVQFCNLSFFFFFNFN